MGTLIQLMGLPAACMLSAWIGRGGADAITALLCQLVTMLARSDVPRTRPVAARSGAKAVKPPHPAGLAIGSRTNAPKTGRNARNAGAPRAAGGEDALLRMRRFRPRPVAGMLMRSVAP